MKRLLKICALCFLAVIFTGCSGNDIFELNIEELHSESNEFQFKNLAWESSPAEVENALGCTLESLGTVENMQEYTATEIFAWKDVEAEMTCEFTQDKLDTVKFLFKSAKTEQDELWTDMKAALFAVYGNVEADINSSTSEELQITTERESYFWEKNGNLHTALELSKFSSNGEFKYIMLSVYIIPEKINNSVI